MTWVCSSKGRGLEYPSWTTQQAVLGSVQGPGARGRANGVRLATGPSPSAAPGGAGARHPTAGRPRVNRVAQVFDDIRRIGVDVHLADVMHKIGSQASVVQSLQRCET